MTKECHSNFREMKLLHSAARVQQGDPLGANVLGCRAAAVGRRIPRRLLAMGLGARLLRFYLDDGIIAGDVWAIAAVLAHMQILCSKAFQLHLATDYNTT